MLCSKLLTGQNRYEDGDKIQCIKTIEEEGIMIEFIFVVTVNIVGLFIQILLADRYWGVGILGNVIQPRNVLIHEGRPWWMKNIILFIITGMFSSTLLLSTFWVFIPFAIDSLPTPLLTLWTLIVLAIGVEIVAEKKKDDSKRVYGD
jgi:hypothetical protein